MNDLTPPPVPADCDLQGYGFMPLHGHRLFGSDFNSKCSDSEWRAGVTLWWAAWNQVPAASLPDDDAALCRLADLGRDIKGWRKIKDNALYGFVRCSDGRLYHPVLARLALDAWDRRVRDRERKANWRQRRDTDGDVDKTGTRRGRDSHRDGTSPLTREGEGQGEGQGEREKTENTTPPPSSVVSPRAQEDPATTTTATPVTIHRVRGPSRDAVHRAVASGSLQELVAAFGCSGDEGEWRRDADELSLAQIAAVLEWRRRAKDPIRHPSGLRKARDAWRALSGDERIAIVLQVCEAYGLPRPGVKSALPERAPGAA